MVDDASTFLMLRDGSSLSLASGAVPTGRVELQPVDEPVLGPGLRAEVESRISSLGIDARVELTLFERGSFFTYRVLLPENANVANGFSYLNGSFFSGDGPGRVTYLTDDDQVHEGAIPAGEIEIPVGQGKPLLLHDGSQSLLMAVLDPSDDPAALRASAQRDGIAFEWRQEARAGIRPGTVALSPRLLVQVVDDPDFSTALAAYRSLMNALYPPPPIPSWFRHQWISWYLYGMDIDERKLKSQIDYIAAKLNDLGPWSILIDAGWYVAEGRPDADWRNVDSAKFPSGLRALVDYAHQRNIRVVLYFSASYLDDRAEAGNWLGLKGIIDQHPDWLVPIRSGDPWHAFFYDYGNPAFQGYLRQVLRDFFVKYAVDGVKVDGMMDSRMAVERGITRGLYTPATQPVLPTTSAYAFIYNEAHALKPDVYVEAGWRMPAFSAPYYTLARQSDDQPDFGSLYPSPGLMGHVDYAIAQRLLLSQRPLLGNFWGDPNHNPVGLQWLEAGLALDAPVVLGFDLPSMSMETLSEYRSRLTALRPFSGEVHIPGWLESDSFSAAVDGATYLALFNRDDQPKEIRADLAAHGLPDGPVLSAYDVAWGGPLPVRGAVIARVEPHTLRLFVLRTEPGVLWTNSGYRVTPTATGLSLEMEGPAGLPGFAYITTRPPGQVLLNGQPLSRAAWSYDEPSGVLRVDYPHSEEGPTRIEISY